MISLLLACAADVDTGPLAEPAVCPPEGEDAVQDLAFTDCAGEAVSLHDLCRAPTLITTWYGWCPTCNDNATLARTLADEHPELTVAVTLTEDPLHAPVDADLCAQYEATYPSRVVALMDPEATFAVYGTIDHVMVLDRDGHLAFSRATTTELTIRTAVDDVLR